MRLQEASNQRQAEQGDRQQNAGRSQTGGVVAGKLSKAGERQDTYRDEREDVCERRSVGRGVRSGEWRVKGLKELMIVGETTGKREPEDEKSVEQGRQIVRLLSLFFCGGATKKSFLANLPKSSIPFVALRPPADSSPSPSPPAYHRPLRNQPATIFLHSRDL